MVSKQRYVVDASGEPVEVILSIEEYERLLSAAGEPDPDEGLTVRPEVIQELLQMRADYEAGRLQVKPWDQVKKELGLDNV